LGSDRRGTGTEDAVYTVLELAPNITVQSLGDGEGALVLRRDTGEMLVLNDTARDFLVALDGSSTIAAVAAHMAETYDVAMPRLVDDLVELAGSLMADGVLVASE